jgi:glycosyltransferase involved in cell wall biosynthesis
MTAAAAESWFAPRLTPSQLSPGQDELELSVVMPCLNEAETLGICIAKAQSALRDANIAGEIIVADNGSSDGSQSIAESLGARVVAVERKGYGSALMGGIAAARGKYIVMGDADASYDFGDIPLFLNQLRAGYDLVMGNRFQGGIEPGAMPPLHRYLGNPVLTEIGKLFFKSPCGDFHCGLRGFTKSAYTRMGLRTTGMEFASEMVVKATLSHMPICEVATPLRPDGRTRTPHLRTWRDGWRHLRFLLLYSPRWLFLYPGLALMFIGLLVGAWLLPGPRKIGAAVLDVHTLLYAAIAVLLGFQAIAFAVFTKTFAVLEGLHPPDPLMDKLFRYITLESGLVVGAILSVLGLAISADAVHIWSVRSFGPLDISHTLRLVIPAALCLTLGVQTIFSSFFLSILGLRHR